MSKRLSKFVFGSAFITAVLLPAIALAQEGTTAAAEPTGIGAWGKPMGAALAIGLAALAAGWAQSKIGSAGQGTLAERPEERVFVLTLTALPEIIVLLGFVMAILIVNS
jgi:V/A-type H+/Na+-transporting ATPase subunit K